MPCKLDNKISDVVEAVKRKSGDDSSATTHLWKEPHEYQDKIDNVSDGLHGNVTLECLDFRDGDCISFKTKSIEPSIKHTLATLGQCFPGCTCGCVS